MNFNSIVNPVIDLEPKIAVRDPALFFYNNRFLCFFTAVKKTNRGYELSTVWTESYNLSKWTIKDTVAYGPLNFSSPGNVFFFDNNWYLCLQSYPINPGELYGSDDSRIWLMKSRDLVNWGKPEVIVTEGCQTTWAKSTRQIDPYIIKHEDLFYCYYKTDGCLGCVTSPDLEEWKEVSPEKPILAQSDTPDNKGIENPCVLKTDDKFVMFFAPCRDGRGIGYAESEDLINWKDVKYLNFPELPWASGGPTAAMVLDLRKEFGKWVMAYHGDRDKEHGAAMGIAWSDNLIDWETN